VYRSRTILALLLPVAALATACATLPMPSKLHRYAYPKEAFIRDPKRPYRVLGVVRSKAEYNSLNPDFEESALCRNYFNKAVADLVRIARKQDADAVVEVRAVTFLIDGRTEMYPQAECADDGEGGQVLVQGLAVKWTDGPAGLASAKPTRPTAEVRPEPSAYPAEDLDGDNRRPARKRRKAPDAETGFTPAPVGVPRPDQPAFIRAD
jgi:hypothetical protein